MIAVLSFMLIGTLVVVMGPERASKVLQSVAVLLIVVPKLVRHAFNGNVDELRGVRDDAIALLQRINWR